MDPVCQLRTCSYDYRPTREGKRKDGGGSQCGAYWLVWMSIMKRPGGLDKGHSRDLIFEYFTLFYVRYGLSRDICSLINLQYEIKS